MEKLIIIRYGELTTKHKNKNDFINQLNKNIKTSLKDYPELKYIPFHDHIEITNYQLDQEAKISEILTTIFGISNFSFALKFKKDLNLIEKEIITLVTRSDNKFKTFKLNVTRNDKKFPLDSRAILEQLASKILKNTDYKVDVHNPDLNIFIQVKDKAIYYFDHKIEGAKGLPVGSSGRVLLLLSGGIDSSVAAYKLMKRGAEVIFLHFATPPVTSEEALDKVKKLVYNLRFFNNYSQNLFLCNFLPLQNELMHLATPSYRITIMRRMFMQIANKLAKQWKIQALATGDALGQVASQTLSSINVINQASDLPILRPLITEDKNDIINIAKKINTYELSILPFEDCCSLFVPKSPTTNPKIEIAQDLEKQLNELINLEELVDKITQNITKITNIN